MAGQLKSRSLIERIFDNSIPITETGCIVWLGWSLHGYGKIRWEGKRLYVHRVIYQYNFGNLLKDECACHKCDNTYCINPNHLFKGTRADNNRDKVEKSRQSRGDAHSKAVSDKRNNTFSQDVLNMVRKLYFDGSKQYEIAAMLGMSQAYVSRIVNNKTWR